MILISPIECGNCENAVCKECIDKSLMTNNKCPFCKLEFKKQKLHRRLMNMLNDVKIKCSDCQET